MSPDCDEKELPRTPLKKTPYGVQSTVSKDPSVIEFAFRPEKNVVMIWKKYAETNRSKKRGAKTSF